MKKRIITLLAVLALLVTCAVFTAQASTTTFDINTFVCPHCNQTAAEGGYTWTEVTTTSGLNLTKDAHYIVNTSFTLTGSKSVTAGKKVVIFLNNATLTGKAATRVFQMLGSTASELWVIGRNGGISTSYTGGHSSIAQIYGMSNSKAVDVAHQLHLYGYSTTERLTLQSTATSAAGALVTVYNTASATINSGVTMVAAPLAASKQGGALYVSKGTATMKEGAILTGADATNTTSKGAAVYISSGTFTMENGTINGGTAGYGGSVYVGGTFNMQNGTINGGTADYGGSVYVGGGTFSMQNGNINGGQCKVQGGAVHVASGAVFNMSGGTITAETSEAGSSDGVRLQSSTMNMSGGTIISSGRTLGSGISVVAESAEDGAAVLTLSGNATVQGPATASDRNVNNIQVIKYDDTWSSIQVNKSWSGTASLTIGGSVNTPGNTQYSTNKDALAVGTGTTKADFVETSGSTSDRLVTEHSEHPFFNAYDEDCYIVSRTQVVYKSGNKIWFVDNDDAIESAARNAGSYVKPWTTRSMDSGRKITGGNVYVDISKAVPSAFDVDDGSKLFLFNAAGTVGGTAKTVSTTAAEPFTLAPDGNIYAVVVGADSKSAVHRVGVSSIVDTVTIRPSANGLYFGAKTTLSGDEDAQAIAAQYLKTGVAVSLSEIKKLSDTAWTQDEALEGKGIVVKNILVDGGTIEDGSLKNRTNVKIYAEACVTTEDGKLVYLSDNNKYMTMDSLMTRVNSLYSGFDSQKQLDVANFYQKWLKKYPELWPGLTNIPKTAA